MARTIYGFASDYRKEIEKGSVEMVFNEKGAKPVQSNILEMDKKYPFEYVLIELPKGSCLLEKWPSEGNLRLTLHFIGPELYVGRDSLAERMLKYWKENDVRIGRSW